MPTRRPVRPMSRLCRLLLVARTSCLCVIVASPLLLAPRLYGQSSGSPAGLGAQVFGGTVVLAWQAPGAPSAPVVGYAVQAGASPGAPSLTIPVGSVLTYSTAAPAGTYYVRVVALAAVGPLGASSEIVVTIAGGQLPAAPRSLTATVSGPSVTLAWLTGPGGTAVTYYRLSAGSAAGLSNLASAALPLLPRTLSTTVPPGTYYVRIAAGNAAGLGPPSNEIAVVTSGNPGCPVPSVPIIPAAPTARAAVTLSLNVRQPSAPVTGLRLLVGSASGAADVGSFALHQGPLHRQRGVPARDDRRWIQQHDGRTAHFHGVDALHGRRLHAEFRDL